MRVRVAFFVVILSAVAIAGHAGERPAPFEYNAQIGVAEVDAAGVGCLTIANPNLDANQPLTLVILGAPQQVVAKRIGKKLQASCSRNSEAPPSSSFYTIASGGEGFDPTIAVVGAANEFQLVQGQVRGDLDGDGTPESFRSCTSHEGLHLSIWAGEGIDHKEALARVLLPGFRCRALLRAAGQSAVTRHVKSVMMAA